MRMQYRMLAAAVLMSMVPLSSPMLFSQDSAQQASAGTPSQDAIDKEVDMVRKDIRSQKKQIIAANLGLTDKEAEQFWPVYEQYTADYVKISDQKYALIKQFANSYDTLTDDQANKLAKQALGIDESVAQLRQKYIPIFGKVISGKKTARFLQIDRQLTMILDLQLASVIPLVQP